MFYTIVVCKEEKKRTSSFALIGDKFFFGPLLQRLFLLVIRPIFIIRKICFSFYSSSSQTASWSSSTLIIDHSFGQWCHRFYLFKRLGQFISFHSFIHLTHHDDHRIMNPTWSKKKCSKFTFIHPFIKVEFQSRKKWEKKSFYLRVSSIYVFFHLYLFIYLFSISNCQFFFQLNWLTDWMKANRSQDTWSWIYIDLFFYVFIAVIIRSLDLFGSWIFFSIHTHTHTFD